MGNSKIRFHILLTVMAFFLTLIGVGRVQRENHAQDQDIIQNESHDSNECATKQIVNN